MTDASNIARMEALVLSDMHIKIKEIMDALRLGQDWSMSRSTQMILHELDMSTRWVPHFHTIFQKKHRAKIPALILEICNADKDIFFIDWLL